MNREEAIKVLNSRPYTGEVLEALETLIPELNENTDERIRKWLVGYFTRIGKSWIHREFTCKQIIAYLEKQKNASYAIEAVERIDKYIDENLANAHDMKDSDPDKKYYLGWDDALGKMAGILQDVYSGEKQKESLRDFIDNFPYSAEQKEHQNNSDAPNESSWAGMISSSDKDKNLDEIAQDYVDSVKEYNSEPTWDLMQTAVCCGYHLGANHQVLDNEHLLSAIQVQFASHAKVENGKRYAKLTWDEFKKIIFELYSCDKQKEQFWVPTDEQRHALGMVIKYSDSNADSTKVLESLLDDLTKIANPKVANWKDKQKEQKPAQTIEEKKYVLTLEALIADFLRGKEEVDRDYYQKIYDWLEGRHIEQKPVMNLSKDESKIHYWTEEEIEPIISDYLTGKEHYGGMIARLRCLKPKSSWKPSEEELVALKRVGSILRDYGYGELAKIVLMIEGKLANMPVLNKLIWKPSEEQMEALRKVSYKMGNACLGKGFANDENLHSLYVALKKLM